MWARTVVARLGQRAVYSWKVQVPQTCGLAAMDLGVVDGRDVIAVPEPTGGVLDQAGQVRR